MENFRAASPTISRAERRAVVGIPQLPLGLGPGPRLRPRLRFSPPTGSARRAPRSADSSKDERCERLRNRPASRQRSSSSPQLHKPQNRLPRFLGRNNIFQANKLRRNTTRHGSSFLQFTSIEETRFPSNEQFIDNLSHSVPKRTCRYVNSFSQALWVFFPSP